MRDEWKDFYRSVVTIRRLAMSEDQTSAPLPDGLPCHQVDALSLLAQRFGLYLRDIFGNLDVVELHQGHRKAAQTQLPVTYWNYLGSRRPDCVLVGDRLAPSAPAKWYPFLAPTGSADFLMRSLHATWLKWPRFALFNSYAAGEDPLVAWQIASRFRPNVVALGQAAHLFLEANGVEHAVVPHPAYAIRFLRCSVDDYASLLDKALGV